MSGIVRLEPSGKRFTVDGNDTILDAALRAGLSLNYGCSSGNCGLCRARLLQGTVSIVRHHDYVVSDSDRAQGYLLMCTCTPNGEIVMEAPEAETSVDIPYQKIQAKVKTVAPLSPGVVMLALQTPRTQRLRFLAGQRARLATAGGATAEFSIASCPCDDRHIQFHIPVDRDDDFARSVSQLNAGASLIIEGPVGEFLLAEDSRRPVIFVAYNNGFAPVKSLIEHAMQLDSTEHLHLYWVATAEHGRYLDNMLRSWTDAFDYFAYTPVDIADPAVGGASGKGTADGDPLADLAERVTREHPGIEAFDVYLAAPQAVASRLVALLRDNGWDPARIRVEAQE